MSFKKAIAHGKEKRKQYRKAKSFDTTCRNHGSCSWCLGNRMYKNIKRMLIAEDTKEEIKGDN